MTGTRKAHLHDLKGLIAPEDKTVYSGVNRLKSLIVTKRQVQLHFSLETKIVVHQTKFKGQASTSKADQNEVFKNINKQLVTCCCVDQFKT